MECFFVDGSARSFADIILQQKTPRKKCLVASYGFGVEQVRKVLSAFDFMMLVADVSHAQLNPKAYQIVVDMSDTLPNFYFVATKTHAKFALVDDEIIIFTSANLSANRRIESYLVGNMAEASGVDALKKIFSSAHSVVSYRDFTGVREGEKFKQVAANYIDQGGLHEPGYTHTVGE
ncbi:MAG: hypothetical protein WC340_10335 [Kiritimatiellia bacterium]